MRKRKKWSTDTIIGEQNPIDSNLNLGAGNSSMNVESNQGWNGFQTPQDGFHTFSNGSNGNNTGNFSNIWNPTGKRSKRKIRINALPIKGIIIAVLVILAIFMAVTFLNKNSVVIVGGIQALISIIVTSAVIAFIIWLILVSFLKNILPMKMQGILYVVFFVMFFISSFAPEVSASLGTLVLTILGMVILLYVIIK